MKYIVEIPKPSAKRMETNRTLLIKFHSAWSPVVKHAYEIPVGEDTFEFEFEGPISFRDPMLLDADYYHEFVIEYKNSTGSRKEEVTVTPIEWEEDDS